MLQLIFWEWKLYSQPGQPPLEGRLQGRNQFRVYYCMRAGYYFGGLLLMVGDKKMRIRMQQLFHVTCQRKALCFKLSYLPDILVHCFAHIYREELKSHIMIRVIYPAIK